MEAFLIKSGITMVVLLVLYHLFLEREKMHRFNRFYLLFSLVFSLVIPFVNIPIYIEVEVAQAPTQVIQKVTDTFTVIPVAISPTEIITSEPKVNYLPYAIWGIYALVTLILTVRFALNIAQFYKRKRQNEKVPYNGATIVLLEEGILPHTFLNNIFLNKEEYKSQAIEPELYNHELTHVKQRHTLDILFIELLKTVFWFNPLLYFYKKAIQLNHEFLADEKVIETNNVTYYQQLLLNKASLTTATISLASNLNFSITKKRFVMMTKTTPKKRRNLLKISAFLTTSLLFYALGTSSIVYAETVNEKKDLDTKTENKSIFEDIKIMPENTLSEQSKHKPVSNDTIPGDARRDEYYSGVKITIDDKLRNIYYSGKYENLSLEYKRYYFQSVPEKMKAKGVGKEDFDFSLTFTDGNFYIDDKKVSREEVLRHKREDFSYFSMKMSGTVGPAPERKREEVYQFFFYSYPFFKENISSMNDHYPDKNCILTITDTPKDYLELHANENLKEQKNDVDKMKEDVKKPNYSHIDELKASNSNITAQFPGGKDKFNDYLSQNLRQDIIKGKQIKIDFTVETDGSITEVSVLDNDDPKIEDEVKRVMKNCPKWIPNQRNGKPSTISTSWIFPHPNK